MLEVVLTGLAYVFAVLALIVLFILLLSFISRLTAGKKHKAAKNVKGEVRITPVQDEKTQPDIDEAGTEGELDPKIICAITAAIDAFERDGKDRKFKVLSFRRVGRN